MRTPLAVACLAALLLAAVPATASAAGRYRAEIRRTAGGVPHVKARDYGSLGYGYGYAYAQDQLCRMADIMVTVDAQRSRFFGTGATAPSGDTNLQSDFFFQRIKDSGVIERQLRRRFPHGPSPKVRANVRG